MYAYVLHKPRAAFRILDGISLSTCTKDGKPRPQYPRRDDWSEQAPGLGKANKDVLYKLFTQADVLFRSVCVCFIPHGYIMSDSPSATVDLLHPLHEGGHGDIVASLRYVNEPLSC